MQVRANHKKSSKDDTSIPGTSCSLFITHDERQGHPNPIWQEVSQSKSNEQEHNLTMDVHPQVLTKNLFLCVFHALRYYLTTT